MSNRIIVMDRNRKIVGEMRTSLMCFAVVNGLVEKYNKGKNLYNPKTVNAVLEPVYEKCEDYEEAQLLIFINDKSNFNEGHIPALEKALKKYSFTNKNPKKHIKFILKLLKKHGELITEYMDTTFSMAVSSI